MTIEEALNAKLLTIGGVTSIVGTRIYPDTAPQGAAKPYLIYRLTSRDDPACLSGGQQTIVRDDFEILNEGLERIEMAQVRDAIVTALNGTVARGMWGGVSGLSIRGVTFGTASSTYEQAPDGSEQHRREALLDLTVIWKRG